MGGGRRKTEEEEGILKTSFFFVRVCVFRRRKRGNFSFFFCPGNSQGLPFLLLLFLCGLICFCFFFLLVRLVVGSHLKKKGWIEDEP